MLATQPIPPRGQATIKWMARLIGLTASLMWLTMIGADLVVEGILPLEPEGIILGVLILAAVSGVATAFINDDVGGSITLVSGIALSVFALVTAGRNHWLAVLVSGAPFMVAGALFLIGAHMSRDSYTN